MAAQKNWKRRIVGSLGCRLNGQIRVYDSGGHTSTDHLVEQPRVQGTNQLPIRYYLPGKDSGPGGSNVSIRTRA